MLTATIHREEDMYVAECLEVGTASQGDTIEEAVKNLKEATELYLEESPLESKERSLIIDFAISGQSWSHVRLSKVTARGKIGTIVPMHDGLKTGSIEERSKAGGNQFYLPA